MSKDTNQSQSPFDDIHLGWKGQKYTIPAHRVMGAIKRIEDQITLGELQASASRGSLKLGRIAGAYAELLRYAGADGVTETDVYAGMFTEDAQANVVGAVSALLSMMIPRNVKLGIASPGEGNRRARRTARSSSKRRSS